MKKYSLLFLLLFAAAGFASAQKRHNFKNYRLEDGLSQLVVKHIFQDSRGFIWIGTHDGLNRFDGYDFDVFRHKNGDSLSLGGSFILHINENREGKLWICTSKDGLSLYDPRFGTFRNFNIKTLPADLKGQTFWASVSDSLRKQFLFISDYGLHTFNEKTGRFQSFRYDPELPAGSIKNQIVSIEQKNRDEFYLGTENNGLWIFNAEKKNFRRAETGEGRQDLNIIVITQAKDGSLWFGSPANGLFRLTEEGKLQELPAGKRVYSIEQTQNGNVMVGCLDGLYVFDKEGVLDEKIVHDEYDPASLPNNRVNVLTEDKDGNLWIGTNEGMAFLSPARNRFSTFRHKPADPGSLIGNAVWSFSEDRAGNLWIGTTQGLDKKAVGQDKFIHFTPQNSALPDPRVNCLLTGRDGMIWGGTVEGLFRLDPETEKFTIYTQETGNGQSLPANVVFSLAESPDGKIWVGTERGLSLLDPKTGIFKAQAGSLNSLSNDEVVKILIDSKGRTWIGTWEGGLNLFDPLTEKTESFQTKSDGSALPNNTVIEIFEDAENRLWLGTAGGLCLFDPLKKTFKTYDETSSDLPNNFVYGILQDQKGDLWMSTNNGLARFSPKTEKFKVYDKSDGLQGNGFNYYAAYQSKKGEMFFGGLQGFSSFFPEKLKENTLAPPVYLTEFYLFNKISRPGTTGRNKTTDSEFKLAENIDFLEEIRLDYHQSVFGFEFTALNFARPDKNTYRFMLEKYDKNWRNAGRERKTTYTNIPPGEYVFKVVAFNNNGLPGEKAASIRVIISPPFWKTTWFTTAAVLTGIMLIFAFYKIRVGAIETRKKELEHEVKRRTLEIETQKEEIFQQTDNLKAAHKLLHFSNEQIKSSIAYAQTIQSAILPLPETMEEAFPDGHFVIYRPKDVVAGDFYKVIVRDNLVITAVIDCTGHGVPGAFMSVIANSALNEIINLKKISSPAEMLVHLDDSIRDTLKQDRQKNRDGMDIVICVWRKEREERVKFEICGAKIPVYFLKNKELTEIPAVRKSVGGLRNREIFETTYFETERPFRLVMSTDGFADQNDPERRKITSRGFKECLRMGAEMSCAGQEKLLSNKLHAHRKGAEQRDDITVLGIDFQ